MQGAPFFWESWKSFPSFCHDEIVPPYLLAKELLQLHSCSFPFAPHSPGGLLAVADICIVPGFINSSNAKDLVPHSAGAAGSHQLLLQLA